MCIHIHVNTHVHMCTHNMYMDLHAHMLKHTCICGYINAFTHADIHIHSPTTTYTHNHAPPRLNLKTSLTYSRNIGATQDGGTA